MIPKKQKQPPFKKKDPKSSKTMLQNNMFKAKQFIK